MPWGGAKAESPSINFRASKLDASRHAIAVDTWESHLRAVPQAATAATRSLGPRPPINHITGTISSLTLQAGTDYGG
jgi:hypothetical protein